MTSTPQLSAPKSFDPQVTSVPSSFSAAKAPFVVMISTTPDSKCSFGLTAPPYRESPQVTTDPSSISAADA